MKFDSLRGKPNSINIILWRTINLFTVIIILIIALVCYAVLSSAFVSQAKNRVQAIGEDLKIYLADSPADDEELSEKLLRYQFTEGVDVILIGSSASDVTPANYAEMDGWEDIESRMYSALGEWAENKSVVYSTSDTLNYASCVRYAQGEYCLLLRYSLAITNLSIHRMQLYLILISLAAIFVAFLVSYSLSQKLSRPIRNISDTAARMAKGDYGVRFTSMEYREIAQLSDTLNYVKDEIKKTDQFQKELLANVSHDLKTPLTMIKAYASMVKEISGNDPEKRDKHLQIIIDESDRLTGLVNDVLNASKISAGLEQLNKKVFNLSDFLYGVINKFGYLQETQGYSFMLDIDPNRYTVADEEKIGQVIYNLLSNAVNYTGEDKTVYISLKDCPENNSVKFSVRDTGKGISDADLDNIWDRYYRSGDAHARPVKGTGLGLNIVKVILKSHAFRFGVQSKVGEGSTFTVEFPSVSAVPPDEESE